MIEFEFWWLLVIPLFFILGWVSARVDINQIISESTDLPASLFKALEYLNSNPVSYTHLTLPTTPYV